MYFAADVDMAFKFNLGLTEKKDITYFNVEKLAFKGRVERAHIKITAHNPAQQDAGTSYQISQSKIGINLKYHYY